ncbi:MAG: acid phosphatase, partial [Stenotrophomonas sp.]
MRRTAAVSLSVLACAVMALSACKRTEAPADAAAAPAAAADAAVAANDNLNAVLWMQRSAEYRAAAQTVYRAASDRLDAALKDPEWDALV